MNNESIYCWYLWKRNPTDTSYMFVHRDDIPSSGFRSLYGVTEPTAKAIESAGTFEDFKGVVYEEKLWVDCDTEESSKAVETYLEETGLGYEKWTTGNRGAHFGINRKANPSQLLPAQDKAWCKARLSGIDMGLYSHLHLFRMAGCPHHKTGLRKALIKKVEGGFISHDSNFRPKREIESYETKPKDSFGSVFEDGWVMAWSAPQDHGDRNKALSNVAYRLAQRGEDQSFTKRWLEHMNLMFGEPKPQSEINKIVHFAYRRQGV